MKLRKLLTFSMVIACMYTLQGQDYWRFPGTSQKGQNVTKIATGYRTIDLNVSALQNVISTQSKGQNNSASILLYFPNENDELESFKLQKTQVIADHVAKWAPDIKTYKGVSTQRAGVSVRATISSRGVNYVMRIGNELMFMEYQKNSSQHLYYKRNEVERPKSQFECGVENKILTEKKNFKGARNPSQARVTSDQTLRTYRIAITGSATYTAHWGTQADAYNAVVNTISRINEVFETDLGVTFSLVSTQSLLLNDPTVNPLRIGDFSGAGNEGNNVLAGVASTISATLNASAYDIGHGFHKLTTADFNSGATTSFGLGPAICGNSSWTASAPGSPVVSPSKAGGISRTQLAGTTDAFDIDYVAHEIGHQFGALHSWSYGSSLSANTSAEPGSGSTIMGYAGTTSHDVQGNSDPYFHYVSIDEMNGYITGQFTCSTDSAISNDVPTINAGSNTNIPQGTAYYLQAASTDVNFPLYFCWEQIDTNKQVTTANFGPNLASGPMARSLNPTSTNVRVIPNMSRVVAGELTKSSPADVSAYPTTNDDWETVSTVSRTLNWAVTVRDRSANAYTAGGQINQDDLTITVVPTPTPFAVTSQASSNIIYYGGTTATVTWDVAQTDQAPINTANVNILLSSDGGYTYPTTLASNVLNNGTASFSVPNGINSTTARVKVEPVGNIYFAINSVNFELRSSNNLPVGNPETIVVFEGGTATTTTDGATSVLSNDTDADGDSLSTVLNSGVTNGALTLAPSGTGSFTYVHDGSETTTDSFTYRANDGTNNGNLVTVTINVTPTFDCPSVQNPIPDPAAAMEDDPNDTIDFSTTFTDPDSPMLTYTINNTNPTLLSATISGTSIILDYVDDETGTATITLTANDGNCGSTTSDVFVVTVTPQNDPPVGVDDSISVAEGGTATSTAAGNSVKSNDTDLDTALSLLTVSLLSPPSYHAGSFSLTSSGTFTYNHDGSETATDSFTYNLNDGNTTVTATVNININPVNDCPTVNSATGTQNATEDDPDLVMNISSVFDDVDLYPMPNSLSYVVSHTNTGLATITLSSATLTIDFIDNQTGQSTVTLTADDNAGCSVNDVFVLNVSAVNDPPIAVDDSITLAEGGTASTTSAGNSVISNDTDLDTAASLLTVSLLAGPQHHNGSFSLSSSGTFTYLHNGTEAATDTFTYNVNDGTTTASATVNIIITPINDCPTVIAATGIINATEDDPNLVMNISNIFDDEDINPMPDSLSYTVSHTNTSLATITLSSASLTIDYIDDQTGQSTITLVANDNNGCTVSDVFLLDVSPVNDPPVTFTESINVDEGGTATMTTNTQTTLLANDTDTEGNVLTAILVASPTFGTLNLLSSGTFSYVHDSSETTTDSFQYKSNDGTSDGNTVTVNIAVNPVNDCPFFDPALGGELTAFDWNEDNDSAGIYNLGNRLSDPDSSPLTYTVTWTNSSIYSINQIATGNFDFIPALNAFGSSVATITIDDGDGCSIETSFTVDVYPINDCPTLDNPIADQTAYEDAANIVLDVTNTFSDIESSTLTYSATSNNAALVVPTTTATGLILDFQPNQYGSAVIVLTTSDGDSSCTVDDAFTVTVSSINDAPNTVTEEISVVGGGTVTTLNDGTTTSVLNNDSDADGDAITAVLVTNPINGSLTLNANGTFSYTHDGSATTTDTFYYRSNDGSVNGNTVSVTIYINNPPVAVADTIAVLESGTATTTTAGATSVLDNDTDDPGEVLTAQIVTAPTHGTLTLNADGSFNYVHNGSDQSSDSFSYLANDGKVNGAPITVSITVTGTNDPPVAYTDTIVVAINNTATVLDNGNTSVSANDIDPDGDPLTVSLVSSPTYGTLTLNPGGTFSYVQNGTLNAVDTFTYKVNDGTVDSNNATVNIYLSCTPCTETIIEAGTNGVSFTYSDCLCKTIKVYVPKEKAYTFCHLDGSINIISGNYTQISTRSCN